MGAPVFEVFIRREDLGEVLLAQMAFPDGNEPSGIAVRQGAQEDRFENAEHRGRGADANGQGEDDENRQTRRSRQHPHCKTRVAHAFP